MLLCDMEKAVARIEKALAAGERIVIYGDYDVDGVTSVSILYLYLKALGADVGYYIPNRMGEGYGMSESSVDKLIDEGARLIVTVDTGITSSVEIEHAHARGVDVVVTDQGIAVNPRRPDVKEKLEKAGLGAIKLVDSLETLFEQGDIVSLHLRLTPDTEHMIGMQYFSRMKKTAYFINTARGGLVDQPALVEALQQGCMAGAALDVYDSEPLAVDDPLLQMDNVLLTPHIAGTTVDAIPRAPFLLMREVDRFLADGVTDRVVNHVSITLE